MTVAVSILLILFLVVQNELLPLFNQMVKLNGLITHEKLAYCHPSFVIRNSQLIN